MFKKFSISVLLFSAIVLALTACAPASRTAAFTNSTPVPQTQMATREAQVQSVEIKILQSSPAQIDAIVRGNLTESCAVLAEPQFAYADHTFQITVLAASPSDRGCMQLTTPFESTFPLNAIDLQPGTYTVTVNGLSKVFTLTPPPAQPADSSSTVPAAFCTNPIALDVQAGQVTYNGITLNIDPSLAKSVTAQSCPAFAVQMDQVEPGTTHPAYTVFKFPTDRQRIDFQPEVRVYTVEGDMQSYLYPLNSLGDLKNAIDQRPDPATWFDGTPLHVRRKYLDFANGAGVRGVVEYAQDIFFFTNNGLLYEFDGLTQDGRYYINVRYPIATSFLMDIEHSDPTTNVNSQAIAIPNWPSDYNDQGNIIKAYNEEALRRFDQMADSDFTPDLAVLDTLVKSIQIVAP